MTDPWSAMVDDEDDLYSGPDAHLEDDDDYSEDIDRDMEIEEELEALQEETQESASYQNLIGEIDPTASAADVDAQLERLLATVPIAQLARIFAGRGVVLDEEDEEDDDEEEEVESLRWRSPQTEEWFPKVTVPQEAGLKLLASGEFGRVRNRLDLRHKGNMYDRLRRTSKASRTIHRQDLVHDLIPNTHGTAVATYLANIYCGQFSADSSIYYTCGQDFWLHLYDMKAPLKQFTPRAYHTRQRGSNSEPDDGHTTNMTVVKSLRGFHGSWTITDSHLSPDNQRLIYSSMDTTVYMAKTDPGSSDEQTALTFGETHGRNMWSRGTPIWCCRWSADGNEVFGGGSGPIYVYDLIANRRTVAIQNAHHDDVNSCCWADTASGNVLISGSDDGFIKVWDRRSLGSAQKPSGVLVGHTEGITYVSAKGDGRYVISNGKDQALRLWDLRKMRSNEEFDEIRYNKYSNSRYDYRQGIYPKPNRLAHPKDCSVMTYRGHKVLRTLIRCHFSPEYTTGGQYLYSGSYDGKIHIWSLDGRVVQVLDRAMTLPMSFDPSAAEMHREIPVRRSQVCVRDVSWHPQEPVLMSAAWENGHGQPSTVARHEWKGLKKGGQLEDWVEREAVESAEHAMPGSFRE